MTSGRKDMKIRRSTADKLLEGVQQRILKVNSDDRFIVKITRAVVFGSYVNNPELDKISDLDIGLETVCLYHPRDPEYQAKAMECKSYDFITQMYWPKEEVLRYVRNRSGYISIHNIDVDGEAIFSKEIKELDVGQGKDYRHLKNH